jgi:uncharacterized membrane protein
MRRVIQGLGLAGGILGLVWGVYGPLVERSSAGTSLWPGYETYIAPGFLLIAGVVLSLMGIAGAIVVRRSPNVSRGLLLVAGAAGFIVGPAWQWPGLLLLVAGGLAVAADR